MNVSRTEMSYPDNSQTTNSETSLLAWVGTVLFVMNILMSVLGTAAIFRYGRVAQKVFEDFDIEISALTQLTLSLPYAALLPFFTVASIAIRLQLKEKRLHVIIFALHFLIIIIIAGLFVGTVLPTMSHLMSKLS